jgi:hypothetical protein
VDGILGHNLLLSRAFSVGIPLWMGFWATTYCCLGPFLTTLPTFHDVILAIKKPCSRTFLFHNGIPAIRKPFSRTFLFSRWKFGYQKAFFTNFSFFHDGILAISKPFSRTFLFHDGILAIRKPFSRTFLFSRWNSGYQ